MELDDDNKDVVTVELEEWAVVTKGYFNINIC